MIRSGISSVVYGPVFTEKATRLKDKENKYVFRVAENANKIEVKEVLEKFFKVKVLDVNVVKMHGKARRRGMVFGKEPDWKKAIVTLAKGNKIEFFEGV